MQLRRGWLPLDAADAVLAAVRPVVVYPVGDDRATGHILSAYGWAAAFAVLGPSLLDDLEDTTHVRYTIVAFQGYRDGAGTDWHTDSPFDAQAVLSLGATRTFEIRHAGDGVPQAFDVAHGDLFVMPSGSQDAWEHRVPVEPDCAGERISLVFRTPRL